jgi:N6-L-threonylcarbamoyladenine synthase
VDRLAREGNPARFQFSKPRLEGYDYSFSGLKTSFLYFLRDRLREDEHFIEKHQKDLAASLQDTIIKILMDKLIKASVETGIRRLALAGGVSANGGLRSALQEEAVRRKWKLNIPPFRFTTDNAAMIGITGYYRFLAGDFASDELAPMARLYF